MTEAPRTILLAAGGTGGHMFPAEATARALLDRGHRVALVTDNRGADVARHLPGVRLATIRAARLQRGLIGTVRTALGLTRAVLDARSVVRRIAADAAIGFGGYASAPTAFAVTRSGTPLLVHEQNAKLGLANRLLAGRAARIATGMPEVTGVREPAKLLHTGTPVRDGFHAVRAAPYTPPGEDGPIRLLILGGSQGARVFSDVVPPALAKLPEAVCRRLQVTQQARPEDLDRARAAYAEAGVTAEVASFFDDVPQRLVNAHLAITRAGASTLAELTLVGRPALLVPYPHAADDHQSANARILDRAQAAWTLPQLNLTPTTLAERLSVLLTHPETLRTAAAAAAGLGVADAAERLADAVLDLADTGRTGGSARRKEAA